MDDELAKAVIAGDLEKATQLLKRGANPNALYEGEPILFLTRLAPIAGAIFGDGPKGSSALIWHRNYAPLTRLLIEYGAKIEVLSKWGFSVVTQARQCNEQELAKFLTELATERKIKLVDKPIKIKKTRETFNAPNEVIPVPGQKPGVDLVLVNVDKYSVWFFKKEELIALMQGRRYVIRTRKDLQRFVSITDEQAALRYARFLFSPGIRHVLNKENYAEITCDANEILFRRHGIQADEVRPLMVNGFEGVLNPDRYAELRLEPVWVTAFGNTKFRVERNIVERLGKDFYKVFRVTEFIGRNGEYSLAEKRELPKVKARWYLMDREFHL